MNSGFTDKNSLGTIESDLWILLKTACTERNHGWRLPVLATQAGKSMRQRTIVLRDVIPHDRRLFFHTDLRSPKVAQIRMNPDASLLFYDHASAVQLQVSGHVSVDTDSPQADRLWEISPPESLRSYLAPQPPGTPADDPDDNLPESVRGRIPERSEIERGRCHFAVLIYTVSDIEWLQLDRDGNRRARFRYPNQLVQRPDSAPSTATLSRSFEAEWVCP
jgi:pyridoxamine 5'-phosphate oxidase